MRAYYAKHREHWLALLRERTRLNPEPKRAARKRSYERNREKAIARAKRWVEDNPEKARAYKAEWKRRNPDAVRDARARRRALEVHAAAGRVDRREIFERDGGRCHLCGSLCDPGRFHIDHIVPISRGGVHAPSNVAVAHPLCNMRRGAKPI